MNFSYEPRRDEHWVPILLKRWFSGFLNGDELFLLMLIAFSLQIACRWMHEKNPELITFARRTGFTAFFLFLGWFLNLDRGLQNSGMRVWQSAVLAWALAGVTATMSYPVRAILLTLMAHARAVNDRAAALQHRRVQEKRRAEAEQERLIREEARRLEEARAQAARERHAQKMELVRIQQERERRTREEREMAERDANQQRVAPFKRMVDLAYLRNRVNVEPFLPEERYERYFAEFLTDELPTDEYQRRAESLIRLIEDLSERTPERMKRRSPMAEIIFRHQQKKEELEELDVDEDTLEVLEAGIDDAMDEALQRLLRSQIG